MAAMAGLADAATTREIFDTPVLLFFCSPSRWRAVIRRLVELPLRYPRCLSRWIPASSSIRGCDLLSDRILAVLSDSLGLALYPISQSFAKTQDGSVLPCMRIQPHRECFGHLSRMWSHYEKSGKAGVLSRFRNHIYDSIEWQIPTRLQEIYNDSAYRCALESYASIRVSQ